MTANACLSTKTLTNEVLGGAAVLPGMVGDYKKALTYIPGDLGLRFGHYMPLQQQKSRSQTWYLPFSTRATCVTREYVVALVRRDNVVLWGIGFVGQCAFVTFGVFLLKGTIELGSNCNHATSY